MPHNNYFEFKQFRIEQNHAGMRVNTDGVLLGAWTPVENSGRILDIGTGTGLIALMLAQRSEAQIDAVEIDEGALKDASLNFENSHWSGRLQLISKSVQEFSATTSKTYDLLVCNPPFFSNGIVPKDQRKCLARHSSALRMDELFGAASRLMKNDGLFSVIFPADEERRMVKTASEFGFYLKTITRVRPKPGKNFIRVLACFCRYKTACRFDELCIETEERHHYTPECERILRPYYLNMR